MRAALLDRTTKNRSSVAITANVPAPVGGWNTRDSIAEMPPLDAVLLDNLFPRLGKVVLRGGSASFATAMTGTVKSLLAYGPASGTNKLFAATNSGIYNITAGGVIGAVVQALTNGYVNYTNIANSAGTAYLWLCNGTDTPKTFDGTTWATPTLTGIATPANLIFPLLFKHRIFAIEKNTMTVWYLPIDSIQGAMLPLYFGNLFRRGGYLVSLASWTLDSGDGSDDLFVVVSSKGEVAIYQGIDPSSASAWSLIGVWQVGIPLGNKCFQQLAGDVLLLTENGVFPLSRVLRAGKLNFASALSNKIQAAFTTQVSLIGTSTQGWEAVVYPQFDALIVNSPATTDRPAMQFVMNTITGSWCSFSGWAATAFIVLDQVLYFATTGGVVCKAWGTYTSDRGSNLVGTGYQAYNYFGSKTMLKQITLFRPLLSYIGGVQENWAISPDFTDVALSAMLPAGSLVTGSPWDTSPWDTSPWAISVLTYKLWRIAAHQPGYALSLRLQFTTKTSNVEWIGTDFIGVAGGAM